MKRLTQNQQHRRSRVIRPAGAEDIPALEKISETSRRAYVRLEPGELEAYINHGVAWLAEEDGRIEEFALFAQRHTTLGILVAAVSADGDADRLLDDLLPGVEEQGARRGWETIGHDGHAPWLDAPLQRRGFDSRGQIIIYEWRGSAGDVPPPPSPPGLRIRPAGYADLPKVERIDAIVFDMFWRKRIHSDEETAGRATLFDVAEANGRVVGYQWCELFGRHAHLTRLAVLPAHEGRGIGTALLLGAMRDLCERGAARITLNTEDDNARSQRLYTRFGFLPVESRARVLWKDIRHSYYSYHCNEQT